MKPNHFVRDQDIEWKDAATLEDWVRKCLAEGNTEDVVKLIQSLPEEKKVFYRKLWKEFQERKRESARRSEGG